MNSKVREEQANHSPSSARRPTRATTGAYGSTTSHKKGGTNITWNGEHFVRSDYGDYPDHITCATEAEFLEALRKFYDRETSKNVYPGKVSDLVAWKLMLRLLRT